MFGPRLTSVFASRWKALLWSAGVLLTAYCSVPSPEQTAGNDTNGAKQAHKHANPWALTPEDRRAQPKG